MTVTSTIKSLFSCKKAGHAGTLDPLAEGVLPIALGSTTRLIPFLLHADKEYTFTMTWGHSTTTEDCMGQPVDFSDHRPEKSAIASVLERFLGDIMQTPPAYSALKINGQCAYALARQNIDVALAPRQITIKKLTLLETSIHTASFDVTCGSGTYVRSLGRDIALALGTQGHVSALKRTRVGPFTLSACHDLDFFQKIEDKEREAKSWPPQSVLDDIPVYVVGEKERDALWQGKAVSCTIQENLVACLYQDRLVALANAKDGHLLPSHCFITPRERTV